MDPISNQTAEKMEEGIQALEAWHDDTYCSEDDMGFIVKAWKCDNCEVCQAIRAMKVAVNSIYTAQRLTPPYALDAEPVLAS